MCSVVIVNLQHGVAKIAEISDMSTLLLFFLYLSSWGLMKVMTSCRTLNAEPIRK